ncbi:MAG: hypothetical protein Q8O76_07885, partial [Chloroflexota bacterium]|nr:hypothetical protein [Chloroflexota bacterium]
MQEPNNTTPWAMTDEERVAARYRRALEVALGEAEQLPVSFPSPLRDTFIANIMNTLVEEVLRPP